MEENNVIFQVKKLGITLNTQWGVLVDNKYVGKIDFENDLEINLPKGKHIVQYKVGLQKTKKLEICVAEETVIVECIFDGTVDNFHVVGENTDNISQVQDTHELKNNNVETVNNSTTEMPNNQTNINNKIISSIISCILFVTISMGVKYLFNLIFNDNSNSSTSSSTNISSSSSEKYFSTAIEHLKSDGISSNPIQKLSVSDNKIIYYGDEILVQLNYITASLSGSSNKYYTATYSITNNQFYNSTRLENMMYSDKWKNAKVEEISVNTVVKMNEKYFN